MQSVPPVPNNAPLAVAHPGAAGLVALQQHAQAVPVVPQTYLSHNPIDAYPPLPSQTAVIENLITDILKHRTKEVPPVRKGPIYTLPADIILHIFKLGISDGDFQERIDFAVLVSHVCPAWRNIALSCSALWADIIITPGNMNNTDGCIATTNRSLLCAQEFTVRSGILPLSVRLRLPMTVSGTGIHLGARTVVIMEWLSLMFPRVKFLSVHCDILHVASLVYMPECRGQHPSEVEMSGLPISWPQWSLTRLTFLSIDYMVMDESPSMDMLKLVLTLNRETLETFEIQGATDAHFDIGEELPTELPRLTHLTVGYKSQWDAIVFLCKFRAPALKHLKLRHITRSIAAEHWRRLFRHGYNAVSAAALNVLQLPRDPSSTFLLEDLLDIHTSMLQQVETLELVDIYAVPLFGEDFERGNDPLKHSYRSRVIFAYRILAACSKLRCLILGEPDPCFLDALNVYPDDRDKRRPVPALTHLHVTCDYCGHLKFFLKKRAEIFDDSKVDGPRRLDYLELATNEEEVERLGEAIRFDNIDLSCLAKNSLIVKRVTD
ncbi:hypothetical protein DFH29DRAFT_1022916 [Suillus ampliporus]|nr:hypothetical protein DFH29DRAFT_1022916 [Suillus ampliporus]